LAEILFLTPRWPWPLFDGGRIRIYETLRHLAARHQVTLMAAFREADGQGDRGPISRFCAEVLAEVRSDRLPAIAGRLVTGALQGRPLVQSFFFDSRLAARLRDLTSRRQFDIIHVEYPVMAAYLRAISPTNRARRILSMHNVESIRFNRETRFSPWNGRRLLLTGDRLLFKSWESLAIRQFAGVTAVSEFERRWVENEAPQALVELVPNGVDADYFAFSGPCPNWNVTFIGSMDYPPNIDAVMWFGKEVLPSLLEKHPELKFRVVGSRPDRRVFELSRLPGIEITGQVPDIRPYLRDSLALIVPLRSGGGTRLKILQALAIGCPVISTTVGAEGLDVTPGVHFLAADSVDQWTKAIDALLSSPVLGSQLAKSGRDLVETRYTWRQCLTGLDRLYEGVLRRPAC